MSSMTTRSRPGVFSPVSKESKVPYMIDKHFFGLKEEGYSVIVFFMNGEEQFAYQFF